ncbi:MAG: hypothetical protein ACE15C_04360 [Phycisphaerae bacterium]
MGASFLRHDLTISRRPALVRGRRAWTDKKTGEHESSEQAALYGNRRRVRGKHGKPRRLQDVHAGDNTGSFGSLLGLLAAIQTRLGQFWGFLRHSHRPIRGHCQ